MKSVDNFNSFETKRVEEYIKGALKYPLRFYTLLLMAGESSVQAQKLMFDIKYAMNRSANIQVRKRLISLLKNVLNLITGDTIIYNRLRSLALSSDLTAIKEESLIFLSYHGFNEKNLKLKENREAASKLLSTVLDEDFQGVSGTGLGIVGGNSPSPMQGIASFDPLLTPMIRRFGRRKKKKG